MIRWFTHYPCSFRYTAPLNISYTGRQIAKEINTNHVSVVGSSYQYTINDSYYTKELLLPCGLKGIKEAYEKSRVKFLSIFKIV